jgi:hypothetical protein
MENLTAAQQRKIIGAAIACASILVIVFGFATLYGTILMRFGSLGAAIGLALFISGRIFDK